MNFKRIAWLILGIFVTWLIIIGITLWWSSSQPLGAIFVLGGSITREVYVASFALQHKNIPILISSGSADTCIWLIFDQVKSRKEVVYLEKCAKSTFGNFYYGIGILKSWKVYKVKLLTSGTHLERSQLLAKILLGSHGIWVEVEQVPEKGIPGNQESWIKTGFDISRALIWSVISQFYYPTCSDLIRLDQVSISTDFKCEHQDGLELKEHSQ